MVFRGRPSSACFPCRQRRIKCDRRAEGCSSCQRMGVYCTDYREVDKLRVCDESATTAKKVHARKRLKGSTSSLMTCVEVAANLRNRESKVSLDSSPGDLHQINNILYVWTLGSPPLRPLLEDFGVSFCCSYYSYSPLVVAQPYLSAPHAPLLNCARALGLVTCSKIERDISLTHEARRYHLIALSSLNRSLSSQDTATRDETLLSVMILANIQAILGELPTADGGWGAHVDGMATLIELRGESQLHTPDGRLLFLQAATSIVSCCLQNAISVPPQISHMTSLALQCHVFSRHDQVMWTINQARVGLANLRSDIALNRVDDLSVAVCSAVNIDNYLESILTDKQSFTIRIETTPALTECLRLQAWHSILVIRILLHQFILTTLGVLTTPVNHESSSSQDLAEQVQASTSFIDFAQRELLDNIPILLDLVAQDGIKLFGQAPRSQFLSSQPGVSSAAFAMVDMMLVNAAGGSYSQTLGSEEEPIMRLSRGYNIIAPVLLVGETTSIASPYRKRACDLLRSMGESLALPQAIILARHLDEQRHSLAAR